MIEAFEIGVSLALQDGISDSILRAQRTVAALQAAVGSSNVSIQALRDAGIRAASVGGGTLNQTHVRRTDARDAIEPAPDDATPSHQIVPDLPLRHDEMTEPALPKRGGMDVAGAPAAEKEPPSIVQTATFVWPDELLAPRVDGDRSVRGHRMSEPEQLDTQRATEVVPTARFSSPGVDRTSSLAAPLVPTTHEDTAAAAVPTAQNAMIVNRLDQGSWANTQSEHFPHAQGNLHTIGLPYQNDISGLQPGGVFANSPLASESVAPSLSCAVFSERDRIPFSDVSPDTEEVADRGAGIVLHTTLRTLSPRAMNALAAAPQGSERQQEPFKGDVYLDGMLVGRWVSKFLRREAERAEAGPTGFDAKRSRLLPGVTVGG